MTSLSGYSHLNSDIRTIKVWRLFTRRGFIRLISVETVLHSSNMLLNDPIIARGWSIEKSFLPEKIILQLQKSTRFYRRNLTTLRIWGVKWQVICTYIWTLVNFRVLRSPALLKCLNIGHWAELCVLLARVLLLQTWTMNNCFEW